MICTRARYRYAQLQRARELNVHGIWYKLYMDTGYGRPAMEMKWHACMRLDQLIIGTVGDTAIKVARTLSISEYQTSMARCRTTKKLNSRRAATLTSVLPSVQNVMLLCSVILVTCCCPDLADSVNVPDLPAGPMPPTSGVCDSNPCLNNGSCVPGDMPGILTCR